MVYEAVIGLEIHVQLNAATKLFCDCPNRPGDEPNRNICPICLWLPGALPQLSRQALDKALLACLALDCEIQPESAFDQKVYYYPDQPKGYQLTQIYKPLARKGRVDIVGADGQVKRLRIHHIHMEEDMARLVHEIEGHTPVSLVDFNRAGAPLIEIVGQPDLRSAHDAMEYVKTLRSRLRYTGCAECSLEQGTLRVDANVSLRPAGSDLLNTKVEIKNMNSIRNVGDAIAFEITRQTECLQKGATIVSHTRLWDPDKGVSVPMRAKFEGPGVPDPTLARIVVGAAQLEEVRRKLPEMPAQKAARFMEVYQLSVDEAAAMSSEREVSEFFEAVAAHGVAARKAAGWIASQLLPTLRDRNIALTRTHLTAARLAALLEALENGLIHTQAAREVLHRLLDSNASLEQIIEEGGFRQLSDASILEEVIDRLFEQHPDEVQSFRNGNLKVQGFLMGQAMKACQGKANPKLLKELLARRLG